jgi:hypothetical protein
MLMSWEAACPLEQAPIGRSDRGWRHLFSVSVAL